MTARNRAIGRAELAANGLRSAMRTGGVAGRIAGRKAYRRASRERDAAERDLAAVHDEIDAVAATALSALDAITGRAVDHAIA